MDVIKYLNYIFSKQQKIKLFFTLIVILTGSVFELMGIVMIMPLVEVVTDPDIIFENRIYASIYNAFQMNSIKQFVVLFIIALIIIYIVKNIFLLFMYDCQNKFAYNNQQITALHLMESYMKQPYSFHLYKNVAELQRNMKDDVDMLFTAVLAAVQLLAEMTTCFLIVIYLFIVDKSITLGITILLLLFAAFFLKFARKKSTTYGKTVRKARYEVNKWVRQSFEGIKEIKIANNEEVFIRNVDNAYGVQTNALRAQAIINVFPRPAFEAICISSLLVVVGIKILLGIDINYIIPVLSAFAIAAFRLLPSFGRISGYINSITYNKPAIGNVYRDLKEVEKLKKFVNSNGSQNDELVFENSLLINNIVFSYPTGQGNVIDGLSLEIKKNQTIAFIGSTGCGKSTLADIILGLLEPQSGTVYLDGMDIKDNQYGWHKLFGYIPQSIYLIDDTIRNNILFGIPTKCEDDGKIWKALERAQLSKFVSELKDGLDTIVGERGVRLSGGQRQRIGIARALYEEPKILVLDEATSALDNETEVDVMEAIDGLRGSRTMIIIAHRLSTLKNCDVIYEIKDGKAFERNKKEVLEGK